MQERYYLYRRYSLPMICLSLKSVLLPKNKEHSVTSYENEHVSDLGHDSKVSSKKKMVEPLKTIFIVTPCMLSSYSIITPTTVHI